MVCFNNPVDTSRLAENVSTNVQQLKTSLLVDPKKRGERVGCSRGESKNAWVCGYEAFKNAWFPHFQAFKIARELEILLYSLRSLFPLTFVLVLFSLEFQVFFIQRCVRVYLDLWVSIVVAAIIVVVVRASISLAAYYNWHI